MAKDGYVVWQKAGQIFDTSASVTDIARSMDLYLSRFNGEGFDAPVRLTNNSVMDAQPHVAADGELVTVVWTRNTEDNILGISGTNSIHQITYDGTARSDELQLADGLNTVAYLNVGTMNGETVVACSLEGDNDLNTINDRDIYLIRDGTTEQFTDNETLDSNPVFAKVNGQDAMFWFSENNVFYVTDLDEAVLSAVSLAGATQLTDDYAVVTKNDCAAVLWTAMNDGLSKEKILMANVTAEENPYYSTEAGNDTQDKLFLLSIGEARKYFKEDVVVENDWVINKDRTCKPSEYAIAQGCWTIGHSTWYGGFCWWWLRSPGYSRSNAACVNNDGGLNGGGDYVYSGIEGVRPVLWINLEA